jgi:hypothetical protein
MLWTAPPPAHECHECGCLLRPHDSEEPNIQAIPTIGLDIAKSVFQVHGVDEDGTVVIRWRVGPLPICRLAPWAWKVLIRAKH